MNLLALETATEACSVALMSGDEVIERFEVAPRQHARLVLPWVDALLAECGLSRSQLDGVACGRGPGAFTGVRLGVAITQGLGLALDRPVIGISTLETLAAPVWRALEAEKDFSGHVLAAIDARMDEVYLAEYGRNAAGIWQKIGDEQVDDPARIAISETVALAGTGTGFGACDAALAKRLESRLGYLDATALPHAAEVARLARPRLEQGLGQAPGELLPAYLRNKVALTLEEQRAARFDR